MARRQLATLVRLARRFWPWLAVLALLSGGAALAVPHLAAWRHLAAGRAAVERFHPDEARPQLDACLTGWPTCVEAHLLAARAARLDGDFSTAEQHLREAQRLQNPPSDDVVREWAMYHAAAGDLDDVEGFLLDSVRASPDGAPAAREALAEGYLHSYRVLDALSFLQQWLDARPDEVEALALRGDLYWQIGAMGKAADEYRRVVELDPDRRQARERLAAGLIESGRFEEAFKHLMVVRQWKPDDPLTETRIARCQEWLNQPDDARRTLEAVLDRRPDFGPALRQRGHILMQDGKPDEAEGWLRRAVGAMPQDYQANWALYEALEKEGKADEAKAQRERADAMKDRDERIADITTRQMNLRPRDPALHCELGQLFLKMGAKEQGERWLLSALRLDPAYRPAHAALAAFYQEQGDAERVDDHRKQAEAPSPLSKEP